MTKYQLEAHETEGRVSLVCASSSDPRPCRRSSRPGLSPGRAAWAQNPELCPRGTIGHLRLCSGLCSIKCCGSRNHPRTVARSLRPQGNAPFMAGKTNQPPWRRHRIWLTSDVWRLGVFGHTCARGLRELAGNRGRWPGRFSPRRAPPSAGGHFCRSAGPRRKARIIGITRSEALLSRSVAWCSRNRHLRDGAPPARGFRPRQQRSSSLIADDAAKTLACAACAPRLLVESRFLAH
jgi:hypothetical protein